MLPNHIKHEYDALSDFQKTKFAELIVWSNPSGLSGVELPMITWENILQMVKNMGSEQVTPIEPDKTVNHDWNFIPKQGQDK